MANRSKAKGTAFETALVRYLQELGLEAQRLPLAGNKDIGDIATGLGFNIEAKNCKTLALSQWVAESDVESENAGRPVIVVAKRIGKTDPGEAYVVMPLRRLFRLLSPLSPLSRLH